MQESKLKLQSFLPAILWWLITLVLFTLPGSTFPKNPLYELIQLDKWIHAFLFFTLCFLFYKPFKKSNKQTGTIAWLLPLIACTYGIIIEFVQEYLIVNRSFDVWDIAADAVGCALAYSWFTRHIKES